MTYCWEKMLKDVSSISSFSIVMILSLMDQLIVELVMANADRLMLMIL